MTEETAEPMRRDKQHRTVWSVILASQLVLAIITAGGIFWFYHQLNNNIADGEKIQHASGVKKKHLDGAPKQPINMLIMGSDARDCEGCNIDGLNEIGQRSDTVILLHVSANRKKAYGVSLPRDAIVDRPDCTQEDGEVVPGADAVMFNTAFAVGGPQCAVQTVESLTGVYIDHFLVLNFEGFKDMVDAVDGVEVCIPEDVDDDAHNIHLSAGTQTLTGRDALNYVRERYMLSVTGDIGRMKRQQAFIASMIKKVMSAGILSQPTKVYEFVDAVTSSIQVDSELDTVGKLVDLAMEVKDTGLDEIKFITVPIAEYPLDPNRLIWTEDAKDLWQRIIDDVSLGKHLSATSISAGDPVGPSDDKTEEPGDTETDNGSQTDDEDDETATQKAAERRAAGLCA